MAEKNPPEGPFILTGPATDVEATKLRHSAAVFRRMVAGSLQSVPGVSLTGDLKVTATGTDVNISVAAGDVFALGTQATYQGMYEGNNDATKVIALLTANPAHATLDRIDLVIARFNDTFYSGAADTLSIEMVTGTPSGSPAVPSTPANSFVLAQISIIHATTVVNPALITDKRWFAGGRGLLLNGYAQVVADQGSIVALADLTGLTVTVTVGASRRIRITAFGQMLSTVANDDGAVRIFEGATQLGGANMSIPAASLEFVVGAVCVVTPTAGSHTYKLAAARVGGTGTLSFRGAANTPGFILAEDIGPA
jgi:hypothetical protein